MTWLGRFLDMLFPSPSGLEVEEPDPVVLAAPPMPAAFVRHLPSLADGEVTLYWEGPADQLLRTWLGRQTLEPRVRFQAGIAPVSDSYHLPLTPALADELAAWLERPDAIPDRVRLHLHDGQRILVQWRRAFRRGPILLSRTIPPDRIAAFTEATGCSMNPAQ